MFDYGHRIELGYFLVPDTNQPDRVLETAALADRLGYDVLGVQDHPYQRAHLDTLALLGVILARTERIRVFQAVGNLPLRPPAVFAKAAATLDRPVLTHLSLDLGFSTFNLVADPDRDTLRTFIEDVAPHVRERVAKERSG
jgi:alkanesulfonate monooxygenase SsuD/methylene tetrahydromethanopterin reductase-like flavin-dependent oxidoreductase (luciferase family)